MAGYFALALWFLLVDGVFSADVVTLSVMEGDSVPLNTDVNKLQHNKILWYFNDIRIALISGDASKSCLYDGEGGIFKDRLKVDYESGSLIITDIRPEHTGRYEAQLIRGMSSGTSQSLSRNRKCDSTKITRKTSSTDDDIIKIFSVTVSVPDKTNKALLEMGKEQQSDMNAVSFVKGDSVTLQTGTKEQYEVIRWYFNDIHIAQFDKDIGESCLYDGKDGIFRDRLKVDYDTGSLTITNITTEHAGHYEAEIIGQQYSGSHVSPYISTKCDRTKIIQRKLNFTSPTKKFTVSEYKMEKTSVRSSGLSSAVVAGIVGVVLLVSVAAAAGVIYYLHRISKKDVANNRQDVL